MAYVWLFVLSDKDSDQHSQNERDPMDGSHDVTTTYKLMLCQIILYIIPFVTYHTGIILPLLRKRELLLILSLKKSQNG